MRSIFFSTLLPIIFLANCSNSNDKKNPDSIPEVAPLVEQQEIASLNSKGLELMTQKCLFCHFQTPDPARMDQMIAPPMLRVQEHYKPAYPNKEDFVATIIDFLNNPSEENTLMPGAVKRFKLMPRLLYPEEELQLIAEALYDMDFDEAPKVRMAMMGANGMQLNNGEKWKLKTESLQQMDAIILKVNSFNSDNITEYNQLAKDVFNEAKVIMLDESYTGELFDQIHLFFNGIEGNMHTLMAIQSIDDANIQLSELRNKLSEFNNYFE